MGRGQALLMRVKSCTARKVQYEKHNKILGSRGESNVKSTG